MFLRTTEPTKLNAILILNVHYFSKSIHGQSECPKATNNHFNDR